MKNLWAEFFTEKMIVIPEILIKQITTSMPERQFEITGKITLLFFYLSQKKSEECLFSNPHVLQILHDLNNIGIIAMDKKKEHGFDFIVLETQNMPLSDATADLSEPTKDKEKNTFPDASRGARKRIYRFMEDSLGRPLTLHEIDAITEWIDCFHFEEQAIVLFLEDSYTKGIQNISYIEKVAQGLNEKKLLDYASVKTHILRLSSENLLASKISDYLSLNRELTMPEKKLINEWLNQSSISEKEIFEACDKTIFNRRPSLAHVDAILKNKENETVKKNSGRKNQTKKAFEDYEEFSI